MLIWTNDPYNSVWEHLNLFQSREAVSRLLEGKFQTQREFFYFDKEFLNSKATQISYSIKQAFEYFKSADAATVNTSPLLYFYGMLSLSKALILANNPTAVLGDIKYHGLFVRPVTDELKIYQENEENWSIENEYAVTNEGVFQELVKLLHSGGFDKNTIFHFKNLASVDPDLRSIFSRYYSECPENIELYSSKIISEDPYVEEICPLTLDKEKFEEQYPVFAKEFDFQEIYHSQSLRYTSNANFSAPPTSFGIYESIHSRLYLVSGLKYEHAGTIQKKFITPEITDYIRMFILSNCVRYKQDLWGRIVQGEDSGSLGIINLFVSTARVRFPTFILSQLLNEKTEYGTSSRW